MFRILRSKAKGESSAESDAIPQYAAAAARLRSILRRACDASLPFLRRLAGRVRAVAGPIAVRCGVLLSRYAKIAGRAVLRALCALFGTLTRPVARLLRRIPVRRVSVRGTLRALRQEGASGAAKRAAAWVGAHRRGLCRAAFCTVPAAAFCVLLVMASVWTGATYALRVAVNGRDIGCVSSEEVFEEAVSLFNSHIVEPDDAGVSSQAPEFSLRVASASTLQSPEDVCESLLQEQLGYRQACGVYVNDELCAYASSEEEVSRQAEQVLDGCEVGEAESAEFYLSFDLREGLYAQDTLRTTQPLVIATTGAYISYAVQQEDTLESIAERFATTVPLLEAVNASAQELRAGEMLNVVAQIPLFTVKIVRQSVEEESIAYETIRENTTDLVQGDYKCVQEGKDGVRQIITESVYLDGTLVGQTVNRQTVAEPIPERISVGTRKATAAVSLVGDAGFCWPLDADSYNYISAYFGDGRGHKGMDIAARQGTNIIAASAGTVKSINQNGSSYGQHFVIDHGNGVETLYAHCSKILVSVGQTVSQGEIVGLVGSTGRSTGPHLHFEIHVNGSPINPAPYLGK